MSNSSFDKIERSLKIRDLKVKADAFFEVGEKLRYEYDGSYDLSSIDEFFDGLACKLIEESENIK